MRLIDADALTMMCKRIIEEPWNHNAGPMSWARAYEEFVDDIDMAPTIDAEPVKHGRWEDGRCSECKAETLYTRWDEPVYDYDWEENLRYSHNETHIEYILTDYCPNCGAKMDGGNNDGKTD